MICIPITAKNMDSALADIKKANNIADIIELRIDYIKNNLNLKKLIEKAEKPLIVTNRNKFNNGKFEGSEEKRIGLLKKAIELNVDYVDIEIDSNYKEIIEDTSIELYKAIYDLRKIALKGIDEGFSLKI